MKILLATPFMSQHFDAGLFWARALSTLGHSLVLWDYRLIPEVPKIEVDCSIIIKGESINPSILPRPSVNYWPDAFERTPRIEEILRRYDLTFTCIRPTPEGTIWLPGYYDPLIHRDMGLERVVDTIYIGTCNSEYKARMVKAISPTMIFGNEWERYGIPARPPQYLHDFVGTASQAKILIDVHQTQGVGVNNKVFELIPAGFTIVDWVYGIEEIFPDIWDKFTFRTPEEARELIQHYLSHEAERNQLWEKQKKAIEPYTYENSCIKVLEWLNSVP